MSNSRSRIKQHRRQQQEIRIRKKWLPLIVVAVGALLLGGAALLMTRGSAANGGTPKLVVEQDAFDYGDVPLNTTITTTFVVRNEGSGPLKILGVPQVEVREGC
jgi:hypothetical protein